MEKLVQWLCENEPKIVEEMQNSHHNFKKWQTNPFHIEGDCWSHTMMVCKVAELKKYDKIVQAGSFATMGGVDWDMIEEVRGEL
jgi:hypothetical protein